MTSIFREVPSNFYYLIFYCEEDFEGDPLPPPSKTAKIYAETIEVELPGTLNEFLTKLVASTNCDYTVRLHAHGCEDICSVTTEPHFHLLFYIKSFVGTENYFKNTLALTLGNKNGLKDCEVMPCSVTYPEICLKKEISASAKTLRMYGDRLKKMKASRVTSDLGCQYKVIWEFQRECYSPFGCIDDKERVAHLCKKLQELQKSEAVFKDSVVDFINILMRGFGTREASHQNSILKVDLGCSNAQCQCFECLEEQNSSIPFYSREDLNYHSNLFTFVAENNQFS